jgi:divalent metal cation (Fe/Co/Zn/Cd) transporter
VRSRSDPPQHASSVAVRVQPLIQPGSMQERERLVRRARLLAWGGIVYHVAEFAVALAAGVAAGSIALIGFGADSRRPPRQEAATVKEASQTQLCAYLSVALLIGLLANAVLGWWWADPAAALVIAAVAVREGTESWRGEGCCDAC